MPPGDSGPSRTLRGRLRGAIPIIGLLAVQLVLCVSSVRRETATYDETAHLRYGIQVLKGRTERFDDSKMPVSALNAAVARSVGRDDPTELSTLRAARLATIVGGLALTVVAFWWAGALYGRSAGLLTAALVGLDPNLIAHSRLVTTDVWAALGISLALACSWHYVRQPGPGRAIVSGLAVGAAQLCKFTSVVLYPVLAAIVVVRFVARRRLRPPAVPNGGRRIAAHSVAGHVAAALVTSLFVLNAGFLFQGTGADLSSYRFRSAVFQKLQSKAGVLGRVPLPVPRAWLEGLDWVTDYERTGKNYGKIYLMGKHRRGRGFPGYFLIVGLFKTPIGTQLLLAMAAVWLLRRVREPGLWQDEVFLLIPLAFFTFYFNVLFRAQIGYRFVLVGVPLAYILVGSLLRGGWGATPRGLRRLVAGAGLATLVSVLAFFPYYISYVNEVLPDRNRAFRIFADSNLDWGQSDGYFESYRRRHPGIIQEPKEPVAGTIAARVNWLTGLSDITYDTWLAKNFQPVGHVARSYLLFQVSEEEAARLRGERGARGGTPGRSETRAVRSP